MEDTTSILPIVPELTSASERISKDVLWFEKCALKFSSKEKQNKIASECDDDIANIYFTN